MKGFGSWLLIALALLSGGCGGDARPTVPVAGQVTLDGQPLASGDIVFEPTDASVAPEAGKIEAGSFSFYAPMGECIVRITAVRPAEAGATGAMGEPVAGGQQYLPPMYNTESDLKVDAPSGGKSDYLFELTSP